ncbi:phage tail protein [Pseudomonas sp. v388]|uniref:phage tail protein n=1 Tax=Pseudomonas sp. v388 TaxID=2479849 RepID=UPI000F796DD2|nr:phage tail protein [Pseudomonas sp. v388]RRV08094.1 phage tail protein [Pseudomonas sp. v388]
MAASITLAGEKLIAQKQAANLPLTVARFILANVPGLNVTGPVDRAGVKPAAAQIMYTANVTQQGYVNPNQVVYSLLMGTDIGDFDWNWIGLETSDNVLLSVAYVPLQQKRKNVLPDQIGNNVTRNFLVVFDGAQQLTNIKIDASTWQFDYTARMKGIDERERLSNRDMFGRACFFGSALQLQKIGDAYQVAPGTAYVEGVRLQLGEALPVTVPTIPNKAWLDVVLQRELNDVVASFKVVFGQEGKADYIDGASARHYLVPLADINGTTNLVDLRPIEAIDRELIKHLAARVGDYPDLRARATTKEDVDLGNIPNAISDDVSSNSSAVLATTRMVSAVRAALDKVIAAIIDGTTVVGRAARLSTARAFRFKGAATGSANFDGGNDVDIELTLADSGVVAGSFTKVAVNGKGLVTGGSNPTTAAGYGIRDVYTATQVDNMVGGRVIADAITHAGFASDSVDYPYFRRLSDQGVYYLQPRIGYTTLQQGGGIGQKANKIYIGWSDVGLKATVDGVDLGRIWTEYSFNPDSKANKANSIAGYGILDAYTTSQINTLLNQRVAADAIQTAGFAADNPDLPYFRRTSTGLVHYLQPRLGFTPPQQGGGANQAANTLRLGWSTKGSGLRLQVDTLDQGLLWGEANFYRPEGSNFISAQGGSSSIQLPPGGTWCYSFMHFGAAGNGITGRSGQAPGGTVIQFTGGDTTYGFAWRFAA